MVAVIEARASNDTERDELAALEQLLRALCEQISRLIDTTRSDERLGTREAQLQLAAFEERRQRALGALDHDAHEPCSLRIGNLEKIAEALDCSKSYFSATLGQEAATESAPDWSVRVR